MEKEDIQRIFSKDINSKVAVQGNEIKHLHKALIDTVQSVHCVSSEKNCENTVFGCED